MSYQEDSRVNDIRDTWEKTLVETKSLQQVAAETIAQRKAMQLDLERQCQAGWDSVRLIRQRLSQMPGATRRLSVSPT